MMWYLIKFSIWQKIPSIWEFEVLCLNAAQMATLCIGWLWQTHGISSGLDSYLTSSQNLIFSKSDYIAFKTKLCLNPLIIIIQVPRCRLQYIQRGVSDMAGVAIRPANGQITLKCALIHPDDWTNNLVHCPYSSTWTDDMWSQALGLTLTSTRIYKWLHPS